MTQKTTDFLLKIEKVKHDEVKKLRSAANPFYSMLETDELVVIGEIKPKSPQLKEVATTNFVQQAQLYQRAQVSAISVLTDRTYFGGSFELLRKIRQKVSLPLLMKDFVLDESQIVAGMMSGANAVLLIVDFLSPERLEQLIQFAHQVGLEALVEIQDQKELAIALETKAKIIGVNSRNLRTLAFDQERALKTAKLAAQHLPTLYLSGINSGEDVERAQEVGARGVLVGSALMQSPDVIKTINDLKGAQ